MNEDRDLVDAFIGAILTADPAAIAKCFAPLADCAH